MMQWRWFYQTRSLLVLQERPLLKKTNKKYWGLWSLHLGVLIGWPDQEDGVVLDLLYEARDVEQFITDKIDRCGLMLKQETYRRSKIQAQKMGYHAKD
jgi:hypothetical protein